MIFISDFLWHKLLWDNIFRKSLLCDTCATSLYDLPGAVVLLLSLFHGLKSVLMLPVADNY